MEVRIARITELPRCLCINLRKKILYGDASAFCHDSRRHAQRRPRERVLTSNAHRLHAELPLVYYNDKITLEQVSSMVDAGTVHSIVISPGPGTPTNPRDIGKSIGHNLCALMIQNIQICIVKRTTQPYKLRTPRTTQAHNLTILRTRCSKTLSRTSTP